MGEEVGLKVGNIFVVLSIGYIFGICLFRFSPLPVL